MNGFFWGGWVLAISLLWLYLDFKNAPFVSVLTIWVYLGDIAVCFQTTAIK